jgi:glycosyltransferase involved in cell wall biosynthesis
MKIMYFGNYGREGVLPAPTIVAKSIFNKFLKFNHSAVYVCYFQDGSKYNRFQKLFGKELVEENVYRCGIFRLFGLVLKYKPDIIHLATLEMFYTILFILKPLIKAKFIYTVHGLASYEYKYAVKKSRLLKLRIVLNEWIVLHQADYILTLSERISRFIKYYFKINDKHIFSFRNGIVSYPEIKKIYTDQTTVLKIISVGSIDREEKGYTFLLESLSLLQIPIELTIISSVNDGNKFFNKLPEHINLKIKGPFDNRKLRQEMANNDIYIASSRYETFSISLLESMNAGLLFITTDRIGLTDYFPKNLFPNIISYGNKIQLVKKILELIELPLIKKNELGKKAYQFSIEFEWDKVIADLEKKYTQILFN